MSTVDPLAISIPFNAVRITIVQPGTELVCERTGEKFTVTEDQAIHRGRQMWVTQKYADALCGASKLVEREAKA